MVDLQPDDEEEASTYEARPWSTVSVLLSLTSDSFPDLAPLPALANLLSPLDCPLSLSLSLFMALAPSQAFLRTWSQLAHFPAAFCADEQGDSQRAILFTALSSYPAEQREQSAARRNQTESWLLTRPRHNPLTHPPNRHCRAFHTAGTKLEPIIMTWIAALAQAVKATPVRAGLHRQLPARLLALNADIATLAGLFGDAMQ